MTISLLQAALNYAELGYSVFPCAPGGKTPLTEHGFQDATTDTEQIEAWWSRHPAANIGIATQGLLVVDVDGADNAWLKGDPDKLLELAAAPSATTPRQGRHYYWRQPSGLVCRCTTGVIAPRVDTRADGGYVLAAPSVVNGVAYRWTPGMELDVVPSQLPEPPAWLVQALSTRSASTPRAVAVPTDANQIPSGQRNATLAKLAGAMRRVGMSQAEIVAAIAQANRDRCSPPLTQREVDNIAASMARYAPDEVSVALIENHYEQMRPVPSKPGIEFSGITSRELASSNYQLNYLIDGLLVRGQPGVLAGPKKSLKTNISIDLAISLATGGFFLNRFPVAQPTRVGVMSGESGAATVQETAKRIAESKGFALANCDNAIWCFDVPQLGHVLHTAALKDFIQRHSLEVLILDPTYLMMMSLGDDAGNLFIVGGLLKSLAELAQETNCTPILCHHLKKGIADPYEPAELENIAWAGFQEFVRQWILLNRRVKYDPERGGHSELWMSAGGSAGHSGLWGLDIDERTRQDAGGRIWDVTVIAASEAYSQRSEATEARKQSQQETKTERQRRAVIDAMRLYPDGETPRVIRETAGVGARYIHDLINELIERGEVVRCTIQKNTRTEVAYRLAGGGPGASAGPAVGSTTPIEGGGPGGPWCSHAFGSTSGCGGGPALCNKADHPPPPPD